MVRRRTVGVRVVMIKFGVVVKHHVYQRFRGLMRMIKLHRSPNRLKRQQHDQENEPDFFHGMSLSQHLIFKTHATGAVSNSYPCFQSGHQ